MSVLLYIQHELGETFDDDEGFDGIYMHYDRPCAACVGSLHRDISLKCCSGDVEELCIVCEEEGKECMAIPEELLGAAQDLWNFAKGIASRHLNDLQRWRLHRGLQRACAAWNELLEFIDRPIDLGNAMSDAIMIQELILSREVSIIKLLWDIRHITSEDEVRTRLAALAPPWSRHLGPARRLRDALAALPLAGSVPAPGVAKEGGLSKFPQLMSADVVAKLDEFSGNSAPTCRARYPRMRLRLCEDESERADGGSNPSRREPRDGNAAANEPAGPEAGDRQSNSNDRHPADPDPDPEPEPKPEPGAETRPTRRAPKKKPAAKKAAPAAPAGRDRDEEDAKPPRAPTKPEPAGRVPTKKAAGGTAAPKSGKKATKDGGDGEGEEGEGDSDGENANAGPVTRSRGKRPVPDEEGSGGDEGKPRKRTRAQKKAAAGK
ncbi:hypothetical protein LX36DRAFT_699130 [Colletotrichum falcatum]|nr:hypothetical protein LX36DRAFT_699130 [Colletotrichum falcatum]